MGVAYYAQHALEGMTESNTVLQEIDTVTPKWTVPQQRSLLGAFLFSDNDAIEKQVRVLSGGEKTRVNLGRLILEDTDILLLDEPTSALDPELVGEVLDVIKKVAAQGYTMLLVSHEMNFIRHVSNRVIFLDKGHVVEDGTPKEVFEHPQNQRTREFFSKMHIMAQPEYVI